MLAIVWVGLDIRVCYAGPEYRFSLLLYGRVADWKMCAGLDFKDHANVGLSLGYYRRFISLIAIQISQLEIAFQASRSSSQASNLHACLFCPVYFPCSPPPNLSWLCNTQSIMKFRAIFQCTFWPRWYIFIIAVADLGSKSAQYWGLQTDGCERFVEFAQRYSETEWYLFQCSEAHLGWT